MCMDYLDALRSNGWLADPGDRVRVEAAHESGCPGDSRGPCDCVPRLVLRCTGPAAATAVTSNVVAGPGCRDEDAAQVG